MGAGGTAVEPHTAKRLDACGAKASTNTFLEPESDLHDHGHDQIHIQIRVHGGGWSNPQIASLGIQMVVTAMQIIKTTENDSL